MKKTTNQKFNEKNTKNTKNSKYFKTKHKNSKRIFNLNSFIQSLGLEKHQSIHTKKLNVNIN